MYDPQETFVAPSLSVDAISLVPIANVKGQAFLALVENEVLTCCKLKFQQFLNFILFYEGIVWPKLGFCIIL